MKRRGLIQNAAGFAEILVDGEEKSAYGPRQHVGIDSQSLSPAITARKRSSQIAWLPYVLDRPDSPATAVSWMAIPPQRIASSRFFQAVTLGCELSR